MRLPLPSKLTSDWLGQSGLVLPACPRAAEGMETGRFLAADPAEIGAVASMRRLDPAQTAAARSDGSIHLTLAGPGSGKTSTLTGRFVHLIRQGVDPARILALTFTKKAADDMRRRIARLLELPSPVNLHVMTFHAFAFRLLKRNPGTAGLPERFQLWGAPEQRRVFTSRQMWWNEELDILEIIGGAKERLLGADRFSATINPDDDVLVEAVKFFRVYEQALQETGAIDFADMVPLVVKSIAGNEAYRRSITSAFDHLLVDEYQDVNPGQVALIDQFVDAGVKLWAVGDDDQTLYAFRASDIRYILEFTKKYPDAKVHLLDRNYRSTPDIVLAAKRLIRGNRRRVDKDYQPTSVEPGELVIRGYSSPEIEARQVALGVAELIGQGSAPQQIAILYRAGAIGLPLQTALQQLAIPCEVRGGADLWQSVAAKLVVGSLSYLRDGDTLQTASWLGTNKRGQILRGQLDPVRVAVRGQFAAACQHVQRIVGDAVPRRSSGREQAEWQSVVDAVIALALSCSSLDELEAKIAEQSQSLRNPPEHAVVLSTIHSAKGLEWDTVFMVGIEDGVLPHINANDVEEERRVAYVGMTRARRRLGLTYAGERYGERSRPSPFLFEMTGREKRCCIWTGPRLGGADDRLPLPTTDEKRRLASSDAKATVTAASKRNRAAGPGAGGKERKPGTPGRGRLKGWAD
jgi:DNA helicase II / ATP-dependent DNA helicase PcrA